MQTLDSDTALLWGSPRVLQGGWQAVRRPRGQASPARQPRPVVGHSTRPCSALGFGGRCGAARPCPALARHGQLQQGEWAYLDRSPCRWPWGSKGHILSWMGRASVLLLSTPGTPC